MLIYFGVYSGTLCIACELKREYDTVVLERKEEEGRGRKRKEEEGRGRKKNERKKEKRKKGKKKGRTEGRTPARKET